MKLINNLKDKIKKLKAEVQVLAYAYADNRTPLAAKLVIGLTVGYLLSPIDLIPDFIPVLGLLDDLIIVPLLIMWSIKLIPPYILSEARKNMQENPKSFEKTNWVFSVVILILWIAVFYLFYQYFDSNLFGHK